MFHRARLFYLPGETFSLRLKFQAKFLAELSPLNIISSSNTFLKTVGSRETLKLGRNFL